MILLDNKYYKQLAKELNRQLYDKQQLDGIIELNIGVGNQKTAEILFAYSAVNITLDRGFDDLCYLVIALLDGKRRGVEFDPHRLEICMEE